MFGKFEIKDASSPVKSIELTSEGEYIVTKNPAVTKAGDDLDLDDVWVYGKFNFIDGAYLLQGFGKIVIDMLGGGAAEIAIDKSGWDPFTVGEDLMLLSGGGVNYWHKVIASTLDLVEEGTRVRVEKES